LLATLLNGLSLTQPPIIQTSEPVVLFAGLIEPHHHNFAEYSEST